MNKFIKGIRWFFSNPRCVFYLGLVIAIVATTLEVSRSRARNFYDFYDATLLFWSGVSSYNVEFVDTTTLFFLYSPVFTTIFTPIFLLPDWLGAYVWNICNYCLFALSIWTLPKAFAPYRLKMFLFLLSILLQSIFCFQYNTVVCYIFLFAFTLLERDKPFWAVFLIMLSATTKIYGGAELALLFCYPKVWRNFGYAILCGAFFLLLPAINPAFDNVFVLYQQMADILTSHHGASDFTGILFARGLKPLLLPNYRIIQLTVLGILAVLFFWRHDRWRDFRFRVQTLAVIMGYIILFSDSPETHTYIIALTGYQMVFWLQFKRTTFDWVLYWLLFVNFMILPTDVLCPPKIHNFIHETFWLDVYCMAIAWGMMIWAAIKTNFLPFVSKKALTICLLLFMAGGMQAQSKRFTVNGVSFVMKYVKGGMFTMGAVNPQGADADELPTHQVIVKDFYIGETEVTQELWQAVMKKGRPKVRGEKYPMERISYDDCLTFIDRLNHLTNYHFRLPTEEEWEYAARGGQKSKGFLYAGSNNPKKVAWYREEGNERRDYWHDPVKTKAPNELGLYDMSGSVWEWCDSKYEDYDKNKSLPFITKWFRQRFMVIRGGSFFNDAIYSRISNRYLFAKTRRKPTVGMRLVLQP